MECLNKAKSKLNNTNKDILNNGCEKLQKKKYFNYRDRRKEKSCGCIIFKNEQVLLIQQKRGNWGFPKGHVEFQENERETAIREVKEETNLDVKIFKNKRYSESYISNNGKMKQVVYFVAKQTGGFEKKQDTEIRAMKWFNFDEAIQKITYTNTKNLFKKVLEDMK